MSSFNFDLELEHLTLSDTEIKINVHANRLLHAIYTKYKQ